MMKGRNEVAEFAFENSPKMGIETPVLFRISAVQVKRSSGPDLQDRFLKNSSAKYQDYVWPRGSKAANRFR